MKIESHLNNIIKKPWGYEYLVFENEEVALWFLYISENQQTSFHAHPNKTTGLIILEGEAQVDFFDNDIKLSKLQKVSIRKGFFHSTKSISRKGTSLFEIESPNNKLDLVRFKDNYGREGKPYEDSKYEYPKEDSCFSIKKLNNDEFIFCNCKIKLCKINSLSDLTIFDDNTNVMFLSGGLKTDYNVNVINPADIVKIKIIKELSNVFKVYDENTYALIFSNNG